MDEQPFTRIRGGVRLPKTVLAVTVRARYSVRWLCRQKGWRCVTDPLVIGYFLRRKLELKSNIFLMVVWVGVFNISFASAAEEDL